MQPLGQHFLKNKTALQNVVRAINIKKNDIVIEIGAGHGELTELLAPRAKNGETKSGNCTGRIFAVEKDPRLVTTLKEKFKNEPTVEIIEADIREALPRFVSRRGILNIGGQLSDYKLIGNIPYYITAFLFRIIGELPHKPSRVVVTIQKEVAERIAAHPPKMNKLAASVQFWSSPRIVARVPARMFNPPPKVDSAILLLGTIINHLPREHASYYAIVRALFAQPRKTIENNLVNARETKKISKKKIAAVFRKIGVEPSLRPQNLSVCDIKKIAEELF